MVKTLVVILCLVTFVSGCTIFKQVPEGYVVKRRGLINVLEKDRNYSHSCNRECNKK